MRCFGIGSAGKATIRLFLMAFLVTVPAQSWAQNELRFEIPIDCIVGETCFVQNYVDVDPGPAAADFTCGTLTYNKHKGTDFRIRDLAEMKRGVEVLAAAAGRVLRIRDGVPDGFRDEVGQEKIKGRQCGNGMVIDHGDGWETQYCHMRRGSIRVKPGQRVRAGDPIGLVGLSGKTEFPHVHISIRRNKRTLDPFVGSKQFEGCGMMGAPLWTAAAQRSLAYQPSGILNTAFSSENPTMRGIERGAYFDQPPRRKSNLIFYVRLFGLQENDRIHISILDPTLKTVVENITNPAKKNKAQWMQFIGKRPPSNGWRSGIYRGEYRILRDGITVIEGVHTFEMP